MTAISSPEELKKAQESLAHPSLQALIEKNEIKWGKENYTHFSTEYDIFIEEISKNMTVDTSKDNEVPKSYFPDKVTAMAEALTGMKPVLPVHEMH